MSDPVRLARPDLGDAELAAVADVLASGQLTMGPQVDAFEAAVARAVGTAEAVAVSSGTAALHLAVLALELGDPRPHRQLPRVEDRGDLGELCGAEIREG